VSARQEKLKMLFEKVMIMWVVKNKHQNTKAIEKSKEMSIKNIMTTSHLRILKQQRCCLRKHLNKLSKQQVIQESTQMSYWNDENVKTKNIK